MFGFTLRNVKSRGMSQARNTHLRQEVDQILAAPVAFALARHSVVALQRTT